MEVPPPCLPYHFNLNTIKKNSSNLKNEKEEEEEEKKSE